MNVIFSGVGGQGLVLTTQILCDAAFLQGFDVKSNDIVGLSQRGGKVWGSVKFSDKVFAPDVGYKKCDALVAMEPLEAQRYLPYLKDQGQLIYNEDIVPPALVMAERAPYNLEDLKNFDPKRTHALAASSLAEDLGNIKVANVILLGILSKFCPIDKAFWLQALKKNVPPKFLDLNIKAFEYGANFSS